MNTAGVRNMEPPQKLHCTCSTALKRSACCRFPAAFRVVGDPSGEGSPGLPCGYCGQLLFGALCDDWPGIGAHVSENFVEIYKGQELVSTHPHSTRPGQWHTRMEDYPPAKAAYLIRTPDYCKKLGAKIGPSTQHVVEQLLNDRPLDRLRSVQAILRLEESVGSKRLEAACARASISGISATGRSRTS